MNLSLLLDMAADGFGDRVLVGRRSHGLTATQLRDLSCRGATQIRSAGADAIIYLDTNGPTFPVALFAAARAAVPLVPLNYRLGPEQLEGLLQNHPKAIAVAAPEQIDLLERAGIAAWTGDDWLSLISAVPADVDGSTDPESAAVVIYTSGTTSAPKGVILRHRNLASYVIGSVEFGVSDADEAALVSVPPYHIAAVANAMTNLYAGRRTIVLEQFSAEQWLDTVRVERVTHALVVPTMLARIMGSRVSDKTVPSLRTLAYGGASMPPQVIESAMAAWPQVDFVNAYGLTETSSTIAVLGPDEHRAALNADDPSVRARLGSAGRVVPGVELEVRGDDGLVLEPGTTGRIWLRGAQVSGEYAGSGPALDPRGFFDTRDHGYLDTEGFLFIAGRADDTIIRGGENIAPAEIEDVLLRHPDVEDAAVIGVPDNEWGQHIEAVVIRRSGATTDSESLREYVRGHLRGSKTPDRITFWQALPRTETGKLLRREVVQHVLDGTSP